MEEYNEKLSELAQQLNFLPYIVQILEQIQEAKPADISKMVTQLNERFEKCEELLDALPGSGLTREEQVKLHEFNTLKLEKKKELLQKYEKLPIFNQK